MVPPTVAAWLLFSACVSAGPLARLLDPAALVPRVPNPSINAAINRTPTQSIVTAASAVCSLPTGTAEQRAQTWYKSGAAKYLDDFVQKNGASDWLHNMDQQTDAHGTQSSSQVYCTDITGGTCPTAEHCLSYTPPSYFWIQTAANFAWNFGNVMYESLQNSALITSLGIDDLITDFGPPQATTISMILTDFGGSLGALSGGSGAADLGVASGVFGMMSGMFSLASNNAAKPSALTTQQQFSDDLAAVFNSSDVALESLYQALFGTGDLSILPVDTTADGPNGEKTPIGKFFSSGTFIGPLIGDDQDFISQSAPYLKKALINRILVSQGYFIFDNTALSEEQCLQEDPTTVVSGQCWGLYQQNCYAGVSGCTLGSTIKLIESKTFNNLAKYGIVATDMYANAQQCTTAHPDFTNMNTTISSPAPAAGGYQECFFNLPVIHADTSPCTLVKEGKSSQIPGYLNFNSKTCVYKTEATGAGSVEGGGGVNKPSPS